jgi:hypothetical protein
MAPGNTTPTRRGVTVEQLAETDNRYCPAARLTLGYLETADSEVRRLAGICTGPQAIVGVLYQPRTSDYCLRALADLTGTTKHNVEKHLHGWIARARRSSPTSVHPEDALEAAWRRWRALEHIIAQPPGSTDSAPGLRVLRQGEDEDDGDWDALDSIHVFGGGRIDSKGTHWGAEMWQAPAPGGGYEYAVWLPQDDEDFDA